MVQSMTASTLDIARELSVPSPEKIVLVVIDGLGGLPHPESGKTELETATLPELDRLAASGDTGLTDPLLPGVTVGSGPGHLALFGYDPLSFRIGRGATSALGIGFSLQPGDLAARINFASVDEHGLITHRRAGRIDSVEGERLCRILSGINIDGVEAFVHLEKGHRAVVVFRGDGLSDRLFDSDPQHEGMPVLPVRPLVPEAEPASRIANRFLREAMARLSSEHPANAILMRGFAGLPDCPPMSEVYRVKAAAISAYPTYQGVARAVGMEVLDAGDSLDSEVATLERSFGDFDFFYFHVKWTDAAGEDGDFDGKVRVLEEVDRIVPRVRALGPEVLAVAGDHSCPASYREHTWHPVPFLLHSRWAMGGVVRRFTERECLAGALGRFPAERVPLLLLGHAGKLSKFGA